MNRRMTIALVTLVALIGGLVGCNGQMVPNPTALENADNRTSSDSSGIAGVPTAQAQSRHKITGGIEFPIADWGDLRIWFRFDVREVNPANHRAVGGVSWKIYSPIDGWRSVSGTPTCVAFNNDPDGSTAVMVVKVLNKRGWGQGTPGEFTRFWVRDGGRIGHHGDQWGLQSYNAVDFIEFWPATEEPNCTSPFNFDWPTPVDVEHGNLTIQHVHEGW